MTGHHASAGLAGLAVALLSVATPAAAQVDTTRRDTVRAGVPVTKDRAAPAPTTAGVPVRKAEPAARDTTTRVSTGEVVPTPVPAPRAAPAAPRAVPVVAPPEEMRGPRYLFGASGLFVGVGAGAAMPYGTFNDIGYDPGLDVSVPLGWHPAGRVFGVRGTLSLDQVKADVPTVVTVAGRPTSDASIYTATLDGVLKLSLLGVGTEGRGLSVYAMGGGGAYMFRGFGGTGPLADALDDEPGKTRFTKLGVDVGGGIEWGIGPTAAFVEARWVNVFTGGSRAGNDNLRWVPVVVGLTFR